VADQALSDSRSAPTGHKETLLSVRDLRAVFDTDDGVVHAVDGVSFDIHRGEVFAVVGESGSGKSVTAMTIMGLVPTVRVESGQVLWRGRDLLTLKESERRAVRGREIAMIFQDPLTSLNPVHPVGRQIGEMARIHEGLKRGQAYERAVEMLELVGIPEPRKRAKMYPHEFSGGMRQRAMIAMAITCKPDLLIADEPTTALDVTVQAQVLALLRRLRDDVGCSVLLITHDLGVAAQIADRVAVMYAGRIAEIGPTAAVLQTPLHPYTVGLIRSRLSLGTERGRPLDTLEGGPPDPSAPLPGCSFAPRCALVTPECREVAPAPEDHGGHVRACFADASRVVDLGLPRPSTTAAPAPAEPAPRAEPVARLGAVEKTFRVRAGRGRRARLAALRRVSLDVRAGESVAIVGESGSGKSTLLRVLAGLETHERGDVAVGTRPQMVFQDAGASLTPWLTVGELLDERLRTERPAGGGAARRERALAALDRVGLPAAVYDAKAGELSGGQRQRVALARAVVVPPDVLLCDEPTSALDVSLAATVLNLVRALRHDLGMAVLFVTHDLSVARIVADRIAVMYLGRIVEIGAAEELIKAPKHPYTKALLAAVPDFGVIPAPLDGEPASPLSPPSGCAFHPRCPLAEPDCADPGLDVPLAGRHGDETLADADERRVACIRPREL
jgi:peptide/nickel transport system ATP-binding protein